MTNGIQAPRGTKDLFGPEFDRFEALERLASGVARTWGYAGIRTPVFEDTGLFVRSIGEATDIVEKEMFTVPPREDKGDDKSYTLRPENTAGVVRAYLEHNLHKTQGLARFFYIGPQFRRERPQAGRLRQFHQMGAEVLGLLREAKGDQPAAPYTAYADVILMAAEILSRAGLKGLKLRYNSVGCAKPGCRDGYREKLKAALSAGKEKLCGDCQRRIDRNVFRVLDCKKPNCREVSAAVLANVPQEFCAECRAQMDFVSPTVKELLPAGVEAAHDQFLVRGLDYYTGTVFEFTAEGLGSQDAVGGGGSYDGLIEEMGGPKLGATGFALGLERVLMSQEAAKAASPEAPAAGALVYVAAAVDSPEPYKLAVRLRQAGIRTDFDLSAPARGVGNHLKRASKLGARLAVIVGEDELKAGEATVKDMAGGEQRRIKAADALAEVKKTLG
ncbi:MAG TPA: histidine--tRNA ligase [Planctomycetota bacterium]|nr:histidine--tRNA ligase [Planctomycetota bacterium]